MSSPRSFQATNIRDARYVWDPAVHAHLREHCSYILVRLASTDLRGAERSLSAHLQRAGIRAYCTYVLYGYYDFLIRAWMTPQKREQLIQQVTRDKHLDTLDEFRVDAAHFTWSPVSMLGRKSLERLMEEIGEVAEYLQASSRDVPEPTKAIEELKEAQLLHVLPGLNSDKFPDPVKVYIALNRTTAEKSFGDERDRLIAYIAEFSGELFNVSVYEGAGFAQYLIKGVVPTYGDVLPTLSNLTERLEPLKLRTSTYLIANGDAYESDHIDLGWEDLDLSLSRLAELLGGEASRRLGALDKPTRQVVSRVFDTYSRDLLATSFEKYFLDLLRHRIGDPEVILGESMSWVIRLELYVREMSVRLWSSTLGKKTWRDRVQAAADKSGIPLGGPPEACTLKGALRVTAALVQAGELSAHQVSQSLGEHWRERLLPNEVSELRNRVAHGEFFRQDYEQEFLKDWDRNVREVLEIGRGYVDVSDLYSQAMARNSMSAVEGDM